MLLGSPCTSYAFLRHEPDIDLDGIGFTRDDLFDGLDQTMLLQRDARGRFQRTCGGGKHVSMASSAATEGKHVRMASSAALASVGGGSMVSWLVRSLLTGKNFPRDVQGHIHQPTSARGCKEVFERRLWGLRKRIKVIFYRASFLSQMSQHAPGDVFGGSGLLQHHRACLSRPQI